MDCLQCGKKIPKPRKGKKFCDKKCRNAYHNEPKTKSHSERFITELMILLKKYGFTEKISASVKENS